MLPSFGAIHLRLNPYPRNVADGYPPSYLHEDPYYTDAKKWISSTNRGDYSLYLDGTAIRA